MQPIGSALLLDRLVELNGLPRLLAPCALSIALPESDPATAFPPCRRERSLLEATIAGANVRPTRKGREPLIGASLAAAGLASRPTVCRRSMGLGPKPAGSRDELVRVPAVRAHHCSGDLAWRRRSRSRSTERWHVTAGPRRNEPGSPAAPERSVSACSSRPRSWSCARPRAQSPSDGHRMTVLHPEDTLRADIGIELSAESEAFEPRNLVI